MNDVIYIHLELYIFSHMNCFEKYFGNEEMITELMDKDRQTENQVHIY